MRHLARKDFHWEENHLIFQRRSVCYLVEDKNHKNHYHLKFYWRDEPTPEFFNIVNARENARIYCTRHEQERLQGASVDALNEQGAIHAA